MNGKAGIKIVQFVKLLKKWRFWRRALAVLECIVIAVTTYALVLPAITLTRDTAGQQDGIVLEERVDAEQKEAASGNDGQLSAGQTEITEEGVEQTVPVPDEGNDAVLTGTIDPESLDLRSEKNVDADVVESIPGGTAVTVLEDPGDGWLLNFHAGRAERLCESCVRPSSGGDSRREKTGDDIRTDRRQKCTGCGD